jgi:MSHA pilin protein MshC
VVELVIVLVLMGILAASAMPRFFQASRFDEMGYASAIQGALRHAQKLALASRCDTRVEVSAAGYTLYQREIVASGFQADRDCPSGALTRAVSRPGGDTWSGSTPPGLVVGALDVYFDAWGRPRDTGTGNLLATSQALAVGSRTVTLEAGSGYVHGG